MSPRYLKKPFFTALCLASILVCSGCFLRPARTINKIGLVKIREQNLKTDTTRIPDAAVDTDETSADTSGPAIDGPLTLKDVISYAINHNLDAAVMKLEHEIRQEAASGAKLKMLPSLKIGGELSRRSNYAASFSEPLSPQPGVSQGDPSFDFSRDKTTTTYNLELSWDLINFGISFYQHMQALSRAGIADQKRRRVLQDLKLNVTKAFWRVQVTKTAIEMGRDLMDRLQERERVLQDQIESNIGSVIDVLETATSLAEMRIKMSGFEREFKKHKLQLASLMGLNARADFELADVDFKIALEKRDLNLQALEEAAVRNRAELFEQDLEERIALDDARIAVASVTPSPFIYWRYSYDNDPHLYYANWHEAGVNVSIDLLSIPQKLSRLREVKKKKEMIRKRRLALAAAILTQLNIAVVNYEDAIRKYREAETLGLKRGQLMEARNLHFKLGKGHIEDVLESEAKYLLVQVRALSAYGDVLIAQQRILNTLGKDDLKDFNALPTDELEPVPAPKTTELIPPAKISLADWPEIAAQGPGSDAVPPSGTDAVMETEGEQRTADDESAPETPAEAEPSAPSVAPADTTPKAAPEAPAAAAAPVVTEAEAPADQRPAETDHVSTKEIAGTDTVKRKDGVSYFPYSLHLSSWKSPERAREILSFHKKKGLLAYASKANLGKKGIWWRIYNGYYRTWQEADSAGGALGLTKALVIETPFANLIGIYSNVSALQTMSLKLEKWDCFPYTIKGKNGTLALLTGAFKTLKEAVEQKQYLRSKGIQARMVRR